MTRFAGTTPWNTIEFNPNLFTALGSFTKPLPSYQDYRPVFTSSVGSDASGYVPPSPAPTPPAVSPNAIPDLSKATQAQLDQWAQTLPLFQQAQQSMLNTQLAYDKASMEQTYPYVSRAAAEATARNLLASKSFAQFKIGRAHV